MDERKGAIMRKKLFKVIVNGSHGQKEFRIKAINSEKACKFAVGMYTNLTYCDRDDISSVTSELIE